MAEMELRVGRGRSHGVGDRQWEEPTTGDHGRLSISTVRNLGRVGQLHVVGAEDSARSILVKSPRWYLVERGEVELCRITWSGRKLVVALLEPGDVFGGPLGDGTGPGRTTAEIKPGGRVYAVNQAELFRAIRERPELAMGILEAYARRIHEYEDKMEALAFHELSERLAALLINLSVPSEAGRRVVRGFSQQDLAEHIGTHRETLTAVIGGFREQGWVRTGRKEVELLDVQALSQRVPGRRTSRSGSQASGDALGQACP